jgi:hypothetical protein
MNIKLTLNGTTNGSIRLKPYSLSLKKAMNEINEKYKDTLKKFKSLSLNEIKDLDISDEQMKIVKDMFAKLNSDNKESNSNLQALQVLAVIKQVPQLSELIQEPTEDDNIKLDMYKLEILKTAIDMKTVPAGSEALFNQDVESSDFWQSLDLNEVDEAVKIFRNTRNAG